MAPKRPATAPRGVTLVELLIAIVVIGIAAVTLTQMSMRSGELSARLLRDQQKLALANSLLAEVRQMPFSYCDPNDANFGTATAALVGAGPTRCATTAEGVFPLGPEAGQTRYAAGPAGRFNNVDDYNGFAMPGAGCAGICAISGTRLYGAGGLMPSLTGCSARVAVARLAAALGGVAPLDANGRPQMLRITVTVACPGDIAATVIDGLRVRHAPNQR